MKNYVNPIPIKKIYFRLEMSEKSAFLPVIAFLKIIQVITKRPPTQNMVLLTKSWLSVENFKVFRLSVAFFFCFPGFHIICSLFQVFRHFFGASPALRHYI